MYSINSLLNFWDVYITDRVFQLFHIKLLTYIGIFVPLNSLLDKHHVNQYLMSWPRRMHSTSWGYRIQLVPTPGTTLANCTE